MEEFIFVETRKLQENRQRAMSMKIGKAFRITHILNDNVI